MASRKLNIYVPAAMVGYFDELATMNHQVETPDDEALRAVAERYAMEVTGVPDGYL